MSYSTSKRNPLLLSATLLAALIAVVFAFAPGVGAHDCVHFDTNTPPTNPDVHKDTDGDDCGATSSGHKSAPPHAALSSTEPGAPNVAIRLTATAEAEIGANAIITVDFSVPTSDSGFILTSASLNEANISINPDISDTNPVPFQPSDVDFDGKKVILTVPTDKSVSKDKKYTITFNKAAGIGNPDYHGEWPITVSSNVTGDNQDSLVAVIGSGGMTTITEPEGKRSTTFSLKGTRYPPGTVTIFEGDNNEVDAGEILDIQEVPSTGTNAGKFTSKELTAAHRTPGDLFYEVWTKDSRGDVRKVTFYITEATVTYEPAQSVVGSSPKITISDWQEGAKKVAAVEIGGELAHIAKTAQYANCYEHTGLYGANSTKLVSLVVNLDDNTLSGRQMVQVYTEDQLDSATGAGSPCSSTPNETPTYTDWTLKTDAKPVIEELVEIVPDSRVRKTTTLTQSEGSRSTTFQLKGEDYPEGTVTIFDGDDDDVDPGEVLDTQDVDSDGTFTSKELTAARVRPGSLWYTVWAKDSTGVVGSATFRITEPTVTFEPSPAIRGEMLRIVISDWQIGNMKVAAVHIAGQQAFGVTTYKHTDGTYCYDATRLKGAANNEVSLEAIVPDDTLLGRQLVEVYTEDRLAKGSCGDTSGLTEQPDRDAMLKANATPVIEELVEIAQIVPDTMMRGRTTIIESNSNNPLPGGARSTEFRIRVEEYPEGTVTFFHDANGDDIADPGEILDIQLVPPSGTKNSARLTAADGDPGSLTYEVKTLDSVGDVRSVIYHITESTTSFEPDTARVGDIVTINITDWLHGAMGVASVLIQGQQVYGVTEYQDPNDPLTYCYDNTGLESANSNNVVSFEVNVPDGTLPGMQTVEVYTEEQLEHDPCTDTNINTWTRQPDRDATLESDATPVIRKTIEIVSELPEPTRRVNILEVDGGLDQELEFEVNPPREDPGSYFDAGDKIEISLPGFDLSGAAFNSLEQRELIEIIGSQDDTHVTPTEVVPDNANKKLILTLPGSVAHSPSEYLIITIKQGTGILTPEIPRGFDDPDEGYMVRITFKDGVAQKPDFKADDDNIVVVKNPISSTVPGATVRVTLVANAEVEIGSSEEIVVDFSGPSVDSEFFVPASISNTRITIRPKDESSFNPSEVLVQGARVDLTIPSGTSPKSIPAGEFTITFSNLARIRNPLAAGTRDIKVSSFVQGDLEDVIKAVIRRTTTIDTLEGPRGTEFILEGKGYPSGTVTVYHDADCDGNIDAGETLASNNTVRGAFSVDLVAREPRELDIPECRPLDPLAYRIKAKDSEGVDDAVVFRIRSGMFFQPSPARVGSPLKITISDWQDEHQDVAAVSIAGESAYIAEVREYDKCFEYTGVFRANSDRVVSLEVDVPRFVPGGEQTVAVYDHEQLEHVDSDGNVVPKGPCVDLQNPEDKGNRVSSNVTARLKSEPIAIIKATIEIDTEDLTLSPAMAARGQRVTITGSGFTRASRGSNHIESVWVGGKRVEDDPAGFEVGTDGSIAFPVTVPLGVADGPNEVRIEGYDHTLGQAILTVPEASITLEPAQGQRGTEMVITGSGFIAKELVLLDYNSDEVVTKETTELAVSGMLADSQGGFELTFKVPVTAEVGKSHLITAVAEMDTREGTVKVDAEAKHLVTQAGITTTPDSVSPGDHLTVHGASLPPFTLVRPIRIAGIPVTPASEIATDESGAFEARVLIPLIDFGDHTLTVQVGGVIIPHIVNVAPPPLSGPPSQVFKYLIRDGVLSIVWRYDNATQSWTLFDPLLAEEIDELNDLTEVSSGDILWIDLHEPRSFQESDLGAGWNLIRLK